MPGRILTLQRQARELGRLRAGRTEGKRPVRSDTWIVTSHNEGYVKAAADLWGGLPEKWQPLGAGAAQWRVITEASSIDALMPPGDPLSQTNEMWTKGGCARRCDGITEQLTDQPCLCVAQFGSDFHLQAKDKRCNLTTRLNLILPAMPDVGVWRVESHGFWAANEIAATVDVIRSATGGNSLVPVNVRIEPRTRVSQGQTKQFPVIVLGLRGVTAGQILSGTAPGINVATGEIGGTAPAAIEAAGAPDCSDFIDRAMESKNAGEVREIWRDASAAGCLDAEVTIGDRTLTLKAVLTTLGEGFNKAAAKAVEVEPADTDADKAAVWTQVLAAAAPRTTDEVLAEFARASGGKEPAAATVAELAAFLDMMKTPPATPALAAPDF